MAAPELSALRAQVAADTDVKHSAVLALNGFPARVQAAVDKALADGVSAPELAAAVQVEIDAMKASSNDLAAAIVANTPAA